MQQRHVLQFALHPYNLTNQTHQRYKLDFLHKPANLEAHALVQALGNILILLRNYDLCIPVIKLWIYTINITFSVYIANFVF